MPNQDGPIPTVPPPPLPPPETESLKDREIDRLKKEVARLEEAFAKVYSSVIGAFYKLGFNHTEATRKTNETLGVTK